MARTSPLIVLIALAALIGPAAAQDATAGAPEPRASGYAPVEGGEVFYQIHGEGDPLVMLHGGLGAFEMFLPMVPHLGEGREIIGIDLDAHGRTLPLDRPASLATLGEDIAAVLDHLGHEQADIMGYSFGGAAALSTAMAHPDRVRSLIMVSAPVARSAWHDYNSEGMDQMGSAIAEEMKATPMYELYAAIAPDPENWPILLDRLGEYVQADYDWSEAFSALDMPVLIAAGDWDSVRTAHLVEMFQLLGGGQQDAMWDGSGMTEARLAILPGQTHYTVFASEGLAAAVDTFLSER